MSNTKIKAAQFHGVVGHGTDGYFLMTNADGSMSWSEASSVVNPIITSVDYPGNATAADPAGNESITVNGTGFATGASVTIGGTAAGSVSFVSATELTVTTPAKTAGDYDIVVTNTDGGSATSINGISYNGIPAWTTAAGSLGTFASDTTISTITLQASEPDAGTITFSITNGTLPTGLLLTGADIDGTTTLETSDTLYTFTVTATDDESQATPRTFTITVKRQLVSSENFTINTYIGNGGTQTIEGKIGTAAFFNGSSSYISADNPFAGQSGTSQEYSISLWFKGDTFSNTTYPTLFKGFNPSNNAQSPPFVWTNGSIIRFHGYTYADASVSLSAGVWYHLVAIENNGTIQIYLNGALQSLNTPATWDQVNGNKLIIGGDPAAMVSTAFDGQIDHFRIFNKALSSSEVTTLYGENNTSSTKSTTDIFDDGSGVALYEFEKGAIDTGEVSGYIGNGGIFNGVGGNGISTNLITSNTQDLTWSLWVKGLTHNQSAAANSIFTHYKDNYAWLNFNSNGTITGRHRSSANVDVDVVSGVINSTVWTHVVFVSSLSGGNKIYINGSLIDSNTTSITSRKNDVNAGTGLYIGNNPADSSGPYALKGQIDQVRVFNKALSSSEVTTLYGETSASATKSTTDIFADSSGLALYEFEGNANDTGGTYNSTATNVSYAYDGTPTNVSFVGTSFQPDLVWVKNRNSAGENHNTTDVVSGFGKVLYPNLTNAQAGSNDQYFSQLSNGFSINTANGNINANNYVAWMWKAGDTVVSNTSGSITSQVSANQDAGFSVVKYIGNGSAGATVGHGLSSTPDLIIAKGLEAASAYNWMVYASPATTTLGKTAEHGHAYLNLTNVYEEPVDQNIKSIWNDTAPTSTVFSISDNVNINANGAYIAYCFHSVDGYQKVGSYSGSGGAGNAQALGFAPRWVMLKSTNATTNWAIFDTVRTGQRLQADLNNAEGADTRVTLTSTGFQFTGAAFNESGRNWIYLAIA